MEKKTTVFNKKKIYEEKIAEHVSAINKACVFNNIPYMMCFALENTEKTTKYKYEALSSGSTDIHLTDDRLERHLMVARGFNTTAFVDNKGEEKYLTDYLENDISEEPDIPNKTGIIIDDDI